MATSTSSHHQHYDIEGTSKYARPQETSQLLFHAPTVKEICEKAMERELEPLGQKEYDEEDAKTALTELAEKVKSVLKEKYNAASKRYKLIVSVNVGQKKDQGVRLAVRCLWNDVADSYVTASYMNEVIWATMTVYAIYAE